MFRQLTLLLLIMGVTPNQVSAIPLNGILAARDGGTVLIAPYDPSVEFSHAEITTDPSTEWVYHEDGNYYAGETSANSGSIFYVVCDGSLCVPNETQFRVNKLYDWNVALKYRQADKGPFHIPAWVIKLIALIAMLTVIVYAVIQKMR